MVKSKRKVTENQTFHRLHHDPRMLPIYNRLLSRCDSKEVTCEEHKLKSKQDECPFYKEVRKDKGQVYNENNRNENERDKKRSKVKKVHGTNMSHTMSRLDILK